MLYGTQMPYRTQNVVWDNLLSNSYGEQIEQTDCLLDLVSRLIRKYKLPFSFYAATPCKINKCR